MCHCSTKWSQYLFDSLFSVFRIICKRLPRTTLRSVMIIGVSDQCFRSICLSIDPIFWEIRFGSWRCILFCEADLVAWVEWIRMNMGVVYCCSVYQQTFMAFSSFCNLFGLILHLVVLYFSFYIFLDTNQSNIVIIIIVAMPIKRTPAKSYYCCSV